MKFLKECWGNFVTILLLLTGSGIVVIAAVVVGGSLVAIVLLPIAAVNNTLLAREVPGWAVFLADLLTICLSLAVAQTAAQRLVDAIRRCADWPEKFFNWALNRATREEAKPTEPGDTLEALEEARELLLDWLRGDGVHIKDAFTTLKNLPLILAEASSDKVIDAVGLAAMLEERVEEVQNGGFFLEDLLAQIIADEAEEPAWTDRRERGGDGVGGAG